MTAVPLPIQVDYVANAQLALEARKVIAARILHLKRARQRARETEITAGASSGVSPDFVDKILSDNLDYRRSSLAVEEAPRDNDQTLSDFLATVDLSLDAAAQGQPAQYNGPPDFDCANCGPQGACNGGPVDDHFFAAPDGGLCLRFIKETVKLFALEAQRCYLDVVQDGRVVIEPKLLLETHKKEQRKSTLPIDGAFVPSRDDGPPTVKVFWPITRVPKIEDVDGAIKALPYLVFHEVFVHAAQGACLPGPRFTVSDECPFTEGAVDAVACEILIKEVLRKPEKIHNLLHDLVDDFRTAARRYHEARFADDLDHSDPMSEETGVLIARSLGRRRIFETLSDIAADYNRDTVKWPRHIILLLNLVLDEKRRFEFEQLMHRLTTRRPLWVQTVDDFDRFLETADSEQLFARLSQRLKSQRRQKTKNSRPRDLMGLI